ncbi:MAG: TonB family protein [Deltaproteobacteria bacterium]|nr:TonB family protein [Deltaproteobacteria bacterium]MCB9487164.1 TonB family protein [Deltaproteobacteria bacterium]
MSIPGSRRDLKIGIVQDGKLISETVVKDKNEITIGSDASSAIVIKDAGAPKSHPLLSRRDTSFVLNYTAQMSGKISIGDKSYEIDQLAAKGVARTGEKFNTVDLGDKGKGKVAVGNTTVLFQVIPGAAPAPIAKVPADLRVNYFQRMDAGFLIVLAISIVLHAMMIAYINSLPESEKISDDDRAKLLDRLNPPEVEIPPMEEPLEDAELETKSDTGTKITPKESGGGGGGGGGNDGGGGEGEGEPAGVETKGLLALMTSDVGGGVLSDIIGDKGTDAGIADAMGKIGGGVAIGGKSGVIGGKGTGGGTGVGIKGTSAAGLGSVGKGTGTGTGTGTKAAAVVQKARVTSSGNISGVGDASGIQMRIRRYLGGIRSCYERELKADPTLTGKVGVNFTISSAGGVSACSVTSSTVASSAVSDCVCRRIMRWNFDPPEGGGSPSVNYTFIFTPAGS